MNTKTRYIINFLGAALIAYNFYAYPRMFILLFIPIVIFACLHYLILQKILNVQFPLRPFSTKLNLWRKVDLANLRNYERHIDDATVFFVALFPIVLILAAIIGIPSPLSAHIRILGGAQGFLLLYIITATIILLALSRFFFAKPVKETWKAILLAGIIAGAGSYALSYCLWEFVGPYLPVRTGKVQSAKE